MPWNTNNIYFIISGDTKKLIKILTNIPQGNIKNIWLTRFSFEECCAFFDVKVDNEKRYLRGVYETWKGHPEDLKQIKAIIDSGTTIEEFANNGEINEKNDLLEVIWERNDLHRVTFDNDTIKILSILTFNDNVQDLQKLCDIIGVDLDSTSNDLKKLSFLYFNGDKIFFSFKSFRNFLAKKLKKYERKVSEMLIAYYKRRKDFESITNLPSLYDRNREWSDIIELLSVDNFKVVISNSKSFSEIIKQINYGYRASISLNNSPVNLFNFSLYRSIAIGLQKSDTKENQIKALIAIDKQNDAFSLIAATTLKEDRLKMLINYAKECKKKKLVIDEILIEEIKDSLEEVEKEYIRENIMDIVTGLAYFLPEYSVKVIEKATGLKADDNSLEWLLGYVATIMNWSKDNNDNNDISVLRVTNNSSSNEFLEKFSKSIGFGIADVKESDIIDYIRDVESLTDKMYLLRSWIKNNSSASNIDLVIDFSFTILLQSSSNLKPTTTILLDLIYPLPKINDLSKIQTIIEKVEELQIIINSPTNDKIKIDALIIESLITFDVDLANNKAVELDNFICSMSDYSVKVEAFAVVWSLYYNVEKNDLVSIDDFIFDRNYVYEKLLQTINELLNSTAEHDDELRNVLQIVANKDLDLAMTITDLINTQERRYMAVIDCVETYTNKVSIALWDQQKLINYINKISTNKYYSNAVLIVFDSAKDQVNDTKNNLKKIEEIIPLINKVENNNLKCSLITTAITLLHLEPNKYVGLKPNYKKFIKKLEDHLLKTWNKIDVPWQKSLYGYNVCSSLAKYNKELAEDYYIKADQISEEYLIDNELHANTFFESIRLMIRFFGAIIENDRNYKYDKIENLIELMPSYFEKAQLWSELAVRTRLVNAVELSNEIVSKKILPIVKYFIDKNEKTDYFNILHVCASAIHLSQPETLKLYLENIPVEKREIIISVVCYVLITGQHEADPYNNNVGQSKFDFQDASEFINLIEKIDLDVELFRHIRRLCHIGKKYPNNFVREQKANIKNRLQKLISTKLPGEKRGVSHEGFLIISEACLEHFSISNSQNADVFDKLTERAKLINNTTDRSYVFSVLATECILLKKKKEFISIAFDEADKILSVKEKISMYFRLLEISKEFYKELFNSKINYINQEVYKLDSKELFPTFRRLIDVAYRVDKSVAQKIISSLDTDPARKRMFDPSNTYLENLELEKTVQNDYEQFGRIRNRKQMSKMALEMLGELNSKKRTSKDIAHCGSIIRSASRMPFLDSINLFEFFSQNAIKNKSASKNLLVPFYEASYANAKLTFDLVCSISSKSNSLSFSNYDHKNSFLAVPGSRENAMNFIGSIIMDSEPKDIYVVDPYFSDVDMPFIKDLVDWSYGAKVSVLTSCESKSDFSSYHYNLAWQNVSSENPPKAFFVKATNQFKETPFHDRWILLHDKGIGIRLGTSINAIGVHKVSDISLMSSDDVLERYENVIIPLMVQRMREYKEHLIKYETFDL